MRALYLFIFLLLVSASVYFLLPTKPISVSVRLKWYNQAQFAGIYVAKEKLLYEKAGLDVTYLERDFSVSPVSIEVASGKVDFGIISANEFLWATNLGLKITAIGAVFQTSPAVIVSLKDKKILTPGDLVDKVVGVTDETTGRNFLETLFVSFGLDSVEAKVKVVSGSQIDALIAGQVDAVAIYRTNELYDLRNRGFEPNIIFPEEYGLKIYDDIIITSQSFAKENPKIVSSFFSKTIDGWMYAYNNRDETLNIVLNHANKSYKNKDYQRYVLNSSLELIKPSADEEFGVIKKNSVEKIYSSLYENKTIDSEEFYHFVSPMYFFYK